MIKIDNLNVFKDIFEIELSSIPNYEFDSFIDDKDFSFKIRTFLDGNTRLSIEHNEKTICLNAPLNLNRTNLIFYDDFNKGVFFFVTDGRDNINYKDFGSDRIKLYYASF